ncbi:MAG: 4-hydroxy-tetrahydrodipicolinate reductase [Chlamydiales bacterium]|jgi:4-hydroxy-tetrahydrodipicolinate reductase
MSSVIRVAIVGAGGRMARFTRELLADPVCDPGSGGAVLELVCEVGRGDDLGAMLARERVDVAVDFTHAGMGLEHGLALLACGVRPLIGTSGVDVAETERLDARARELELGGLVVPNFSRGVWLQQKLVLLAAAHLPALEIIEEHHVRKRDAPSGTALDTAEQLAAAGHAGPIPIHSTRLPGVLSNQSVVFGGEGEVLRIRHETYGREAFGPGIRAGLAYAAQAHGVVRGIGHAFERPG